jgi:hypothetical protein
MPLTAVLNKIGLSVRRLKDGKSFFDKKLLKLTGLEHFAHDVASADEFALDVSGSGFLEQYLLKRPATNVQVC